MSLTGAMESTLGKVSSPGFTGGSQGNEGVTRVLFKRRK